MEDKSHERLVARLSSHFEDLVEAGFGFFHRESALFFDFFDNEHSFDQIRATLDLALPDAKDKALQYKLVGDFKLEVENREQAASIGCEFLRLISQESTPPRGIYNNVFNVDNPGIFDRPRDQTESDNRSLAAVKDRFLRPFKRYVLENAATGPESQFNATDYNHLTGLLERKAFDDELQRLSDSSLATSTPLALMMIDIDHFKKVNDTYGHPIGDEVLKEVGQILAKSVLARGNAFRYGGEEFTVLLENHSAYEAAELAERIRIAIADASLSSENLKITASIGIHESRDGDIKRLVHEADQALYTAKRRGRDVVIVFGDEESDQEPELRPGPKSHRKKPIDHTSLDDSMKEAIRQNYFQSGIARCPFDSALMEVQKYWIDERKTPDLQVTCPSCGVSEFLPGPK